MVEPGVDLGSEGRSSSTGGGVVPSARRRGSPEGARRGEGVAAPLRRTPWAWGRAKFWRRGMDRRGRCRRRSRRRGRPGEGPACTEDPAAAEGSGCAEDGATRDLTTVGWLGGHSGGGEPGLSAGGQSDLRTLLRVLLPERPSVESLCLFPH